MNNDKPCDNLDEFPSSKETKGGTSASGAYQFLRGSYKVYTDKEFVSDFSEESQDKVCIQMIKNKNVYDNILKGDFDTAIDALKTQKGGGVVFQGLDNGDPSGAFKEYLKKELSGTSLVKTKKGKLLF